MTDRDWELGDRVRTSFDGEEFPGVYKIVGFSIDNESAQLESEHNNDLTWSPLDGLVLVTTPPPGPLSYKESNQVQAFAGFVLKLDAEKQGAALALLAALLED